MFMFIGSDVNKLMNELKVYEANKNSSFFIVGYDSWSNHDATIKKLLDIVNLKSNFQLEKLLVGRTNIDRPKIINIDKDLISFDLDNNLIINVDAFDGYAEIKKGKFPDVTIDKRVEIRTLVDTILPLTSYMGCFSLANLGQPYMANGRYYYDYTGYKALFMEKAGSTFSGTECFFEEFFKDYMRKEYSNSTN